MMTERKVLIVSLQKMGGGARDGLEFSNGLVEDGFAHGAVISAGNVYAEEWAAQKNFRTTIKVSTYGSSKWSFLFWTMTLVRPLRFIMRVLKERPSVVHIINFHPWATLVYMARPFAGYKIIYAFQDNPFDPKEQPQPAMNAIERSFLRHADVLAAYSEFIREDIHAYLPAKTVVVLPLGIYGGLFPNMPEKKFHTTGKLAVLFFGRIERYKGVGLLVNAVELLSREKLDLEVTIAGRGTVDGGIARLITGLGIVFKNYWITDWELRLLVTAADVIIAPYEKATQSGIISVALACHVPVIATRVGSFPEYIKDGVNGFLIEHSAEELAAKLALLYANRDMLLKMSEGARRVAKEFAWAAIGHTAIELYKKMG
jgi:glycosyltransferase involved in cell wall biosynthesis